MSTQCLFAAGLYCSDDSKRRCIVELIQGHQGWPHIISRPGSTLMIRRTYWLASQYRSLRRITRRMGETKAWLDGTALMISLHLTTWESTMLPRFQRSVYLFRSYSWPGRKASTHMRHRALEARPDEAFRRNTASSGPNPVLFRRNMSSPS